MNQGLVGRLTAVKQRLTGIHSRLGDGRYQQVVIISPSGNNTVISPKVLVKSVNPRTITNYLNTGVEIALEDLEVSGISKTYPLDVLYGTWLIGEEPDQVRAEVLDIDDTSLLDYTVILRVFRKR